MKTTKLSIILLLFTLIQVRSIKAQETEQKVIPTINLNGPRVGATYLGQGEALDRLSEVWGKDVQPIVTQFGWQFETRFFSLPSGTAGLVEAVILIGGLEQNLFLPSATFLVGLRNSKGLEIGFGPNLSLSGAAFAFAAGMTFSSNQINFPVNLAVVPATDGVRVSLLIGFNARKR